MKTNMIICSSLACLTLIFATGCTSSHVDNRSSSTSVALNSRNYRLVKPGASGSSYGFRLFGLLPLASPHYAAARTKLYQSMDQPLTGKAIALTNELQDKSTVYLILFSVPKFTLTADVIEFVDPAAPQPGLHAAAGQ